MFLETTPDHWVNMKLIKYFNTETLKDEKSPIGRSYKITLTLVDGSTHFCTYVSLKKFVYTVRRLNKIKED